ncbi:hybrid sensor histidine kinase/response regulator [Rhodopseudomonas palustris]|uniref:histidine kinase n=1 Tax=Rhodopseudomonas palustris TaxID=1076 RepID=A0A323UDG4_RHOPL|nr:hybrid sensor histidine kinase/response regulator [Rhodopseudomonas palustris]
MTGPLLLRQQKQLVDRTIKLAQERGYSDGASSLRAAWTESIDSLNEGLVAYLADHVRSGGHNGRYDYRVDSRFARLRRAAQAHHDLGIPLEMHNGLFKIYHRAYREHFTDLFSQASVKDEAALQLSPPDEFIRRLDDFFGEAELAMLAPWAATESKEGAFAETQRRLTRERDQYFAALESLRSPVLIVADNGTLITANQAALQTFAGVSEPGGLNYRLALQTHRKDLQAVVDQIVGVAGNEWDAIWMPTRLGSRCFDIRLRRVEDTANKLEASLILLLHDVTEHRAAISKARESERTMSLFLAAMSHEIRAPLHSILGIVGLMKEADGQQQRELIDLLEISARSLNSTLGNVMNFSRFEHQAPVPRPEKVILSKALNDVIRVKSVFARQRAIPLRLDRAEGMPDEVQLDWSMFEQVLGNLIQNALRYDDGRGVEVRARLDRGALVFRVSDHGPGLPEEIAEMLKHPPSELRPRVTHRTGSGLGLAIAQRMTLALGGSLDAIEERDGAVLEIRLPLVLPDPGVAADGAGLGQRQLGLSCLLVDDDDINAWVTTAMLERAGLAVDHAQSLAEANVLRDAASDQYDIFIVDYRLPDGTGVQFAEDLRRDPAYSATPLFLLSANVDVVRESAEQRGLFTALLQKPLDAEALSKAIYGLSPRPADMLGGLSDAARTKMADAFLQSWVEFRSMLSEIKPGCPDVELTVQAHKLASGSAIFGFNDLATMLRQLEQAGVERAPWSVTGPIVSRLLAYALPEGCLAIGPTKQSK